MSTDLVLAEPTSSFDLLPKAHDLATAIAKTEFVPKGLRNRPEAVMACVLAGHEMGIGPMMALAKIDVIEGKPAPSAELMRAVVLAHGHEVWLEEQTATRVTLCGKRRDSDHTTKVTWTMDDARRAGLDRKAVWKSYPRAMLLARATGELCRAVFPDVLAGLSYTAEEVTDGFIEDVEATEGVEEAPAGSTRSLAGSGATKKRPAKKAAAKKAAPAAQPPAADDLPPLPGDEEDIIDAEVVEEPAADPDVGKRAQQIAMRARDLGVDHHDVVAAVTGGRATSAKAIDAATAADVLEALRQIKVGTKVLDVSGDVPRLADAPEPETPVEADADLAEVGSWDGDAWRAWLRTQNVRVVDVMREAKRLAVDAGVAEPMSLDDLRASASLAAMVAGWVEGESEESGR